MYGCTGVQVPPLSYILFPCSGVCWSGSALLPEPTRYHFHPFSLLLETIGTTWNLYDPRILLDVPCPPVHDKQKTSTWCWGVDSWGRRIMRTMGWWRKVNLCSTLWVRLLKASDTIRLWNSMFDKKQKLKELYGIGRVRLDQHTSIIFNPRLNLKKHPFGTVQSWKMLEKGTQTIDKNQQQLLHTIAFSTFRLSQDNLHV